MSTRPTPSAVIRDAGRASIVSVDAEGGILEVLDGDGKRVVDMYSSEGFELISDLWLKVGWNQKYVYSFSWLGRPIIQLPDDLIRMQEVLHAVQPDLIVECGVAHGGSLIYYASLCKIFGKGRVVGIDVEIRPHNRSAIEQHPLASLITLIEGSSTDAATVSRVESEIGAGQSVLVILDSNHTREHVRKELDAYAPLVTVGSYVVVMDGIMRAVADTPRGRPEWIEDNPVGAVHDFVREHPEFVVREPDWPFNESELQRNVTHWPEGYLLRTR